jgi:hypothetical protein
MRMLEFETYHVWLEALYQRLSDLNVGTHFYVEVFCSDWPQNRAGTAIGEI